jgi:translation initiation factor IF-3
VIADDNEQLGIMAPQAALKIAEERGLDLVEVAPTANPPVCRIMDYGKYLYQLNKKTSRSQEAPEEHYGQGSEVSTQHRRARLRLQEESHRAIPETRGQSQSGGLF